MQSEIKTETRPNPSATNGMPLSAHAGNGEHVEKQNEPTELEAGRPQVEENEYPSTASGMLIIVSCLLSMFLLCVDRTIISTAIPRITDEFHSVPDIGWYGSSYLLTNCSFQLLYGRLYKFFRVKYVFLISITLFEIGSAVAGSAPSSSAFIIGRAIAGIGAAGIMSGEMQIVVNTTPLSKRPLIAGLFGAVGGISSIAGPLLGGLLTEKLSWRWCFWVNVPCGVVCVLAVIFLLKNYKPAEGDLPFREKISRIDLIGTAIFLPCITCLILTLQWGGSSYSWSNWRIILLFVIFGVLLVAWLAVQAWKTEKATVPFRIFFQRNIIAGVANATIMNAALTIGIYEIPLWFQAVKGDSPLRSGIFTIPTIAALVLASVFSGILTQRISSYWQVMTLAPIFASVGAGLMTTLRPDTNEWKWIAFEILVGLGLGLGAQQTLVAQTVLSDTDVSIGIALIFFGQQLGGAVFLAIADTIFIQQLTKGLKDIPGADAQAIINAGAANFRSAIPVSLLSKLVLAYNSAITDALCLAAGLAAFNIIPVLFIEHRSLKSKGSRKVDSGEDTGGQAGVADATADV